MTDDAYARGHYSGPAVFWNVRNDIAQEEIFGPVLVVVQVGSFEEALEDVNDIDYGLSASVVS